MKKLSFPLLPILLLLLSLAAHAQTTPQIAKVSASTSNSTYLLGNSTASRTQTLYAPGDFTGATAGLITHLYFQYGSTGQNAGNTLTNLTIQLGQTSMITYGGSNTFLTGLTQVLSAASYTIAPGTTGQWFAIPLDNTFAFDPSQTLILDISFGSSATSNFGTIGDPTSRPNASDKKLYAGSASATTGIRTSTTWQHFGFDVTPLGIVPPRPDATALLAYPNPASGVVAVRLPDSSPDAAGLTLSDALGRVVRTVGLVPGELLTGTSLPLTGLPAGTYLLEVRQSDRRFIRRLIIE